MKKSLRNRIFALLLEAIMLLGISVPVSAETIYLNTNTIVTLYSGTNTYTAGGTTQRQNKAYLCTSQYKVTNLKSSKASVVKIKAKKYSDGYYIYLYPKKAGTATVSFQTGGTTYKTKVTVKKYVNPVESVTIGSRKYTASDFMKNSVLKLKYSDFANKKVRLKVSKKDGWMLTGLSYTRNGWKKSETISNGQSVQVKGGKGFFFTLDFLNSTTGQTESIIIYLK